MNKERVSLADIDTDWQPNKRDKVKEYIYSMKGLYCADIITFNTVALKGSIRDVGRALGMCGFGIDVSVASYEEVQNAINNQENKVEPKATEKQISMIEDLYNDAELEEILKWAKVTDLKDLTVEKASALISKRKGK